ncbi:methylated-DNA--protein-cysteine methyltransferase isoform X3 [Numida meleagris]|uniref:methylated-DNA--protein-cysteine methyltransferase isoform X3 n=1 Tax=Numida meleagris TaxID=8996 RepID=UPI000B3DF39A|nr:methylated-DNA--protein-cysteine methyltransferase isoform X3 [Numida meleagris]
MPGQLLLAPVGLWGMFTEPAQTCPALCPQPTMRCAALGLPAAGSTRAGPGRPRDGGRRCCRKAGRHLSSTMASRRVPKVTSKEGASPCQEKHAVLLSPVGKLEISGCETGVHEIKLPKMSVLPNGTEAPLRCELCGGAAAMPEPLQQCVAWLSAYFCEPSRMGQLPLPPFHHPMLQQDPNYHTVPQGDLQQRADWQLRSRKPYERVAFVTREAPETEVSRLMRLSHSCSTAKAHNRSNLAYNELSEHPAEFRKMVNI